MMHNNNSISNHKLQILFLQNCLLESGLIGRQNETCGAIQLPCGAKEPPTAEASFARQGGIIAKLNLAIYVQIVRLSIYLVHYYSSVISLLEDSFLYF